MCVCVRGVGLEGVYLWIGNNVIFSVFIYIAASDIVCLVYC